MVTQAFVAGTGISVKSIYSTNAPAVSVRPQRPAVHSIGKFRAAPAPKFGCSSLYVQNNRTSYGPIMVVSGTKPITKEQVINAQEKWAAGVIKIGSLKDQREECKAFTSDFLDERYAFDLGPVLFKPTKCADVQFRPTKTDAMSYFIAGDVREYKEDGGFAVTPWTKIRFNNTGYILEDDRAVVQGNYWFTDLSGGETKVEYTFGYKAVGGDLKIDLHHSSLPFPSS